MKKLCVTSAALLLAAILLHSAPSNVSAKSDKFKRSRRPIADQFIVVLNDGTENIKFDPDAVISDLNRRFPGTIGKVYSSALNGYSVQMNPVRAQALSDDPLVKYVEEDSYVSETDVETNPGWGLDRLDQRFIPFDFTYNFTGRGTGVNIYILDSGILSTHVELQGRVVSAYDAVHGQTGSQCNGHGTTVAGVAGSTTFGVAKNSMLQDVRILPCTGYGSVSDLISGVDWVTRHAVRPAVANMSVQTTYSKSLNDSVSSSIASGVIYVVSAGNNSGDACGYSPSAISEAIVVGSTNSTDTRVSWSNTGTCVDLFAPGEGVSTISNETDTTTTYASGTSYSSPYVAGIAALYLEQHPAATPAEVSVAITSLATTGVVIDAGIGSPNLLAYSLLPSPPPVPSSCEGTAYSGMLPGSGWSDYQSSLSGFNGGSGVYAANLSMPPGAVFSLSLEKQSRGRWAVAASSSTGGPIRYRGKSGTYRWRVADVSGSGNYDLCASTP